MSNWRGFLIESKSYMGYDGLPCWKKVRFWWQFPRKWVWFRIVRLWDWYRGVGLDV